MKRYVLLGIMSLAAAQPAVAQYRQPSAQPYSGNRAESPRQLIDQLQRRVDYDFQRGIIRREVFDCASIVVIENPFGVTLEINNVVGSLRDDRRA